MPVVYITGSSAGLGRAIAGAYAAAGYTVGLIARDERALAIAAGEIGNGAAWAAADVADAGQLEQAAQTLVAALGPPDVWINNAMATIFSRFADIAPEEFARATNVTFLGSMYGIQVALRLMKPRGRGQIIQVGSALAYRAVPLQAPYCASKAAIREGINSPALRIAARQVAGAHHHGPHAGDEHAAIRLGPPPYRRIPAADGPDLRA